MILRCVKKAISYKYPYVIAIVVPYQIYTVVMMTTCANQEYNCLDMEYSVTSVVTSKKAMVYVAMTMGNPWFKSPTIY